MVYSKYLSITAIATTLLFSGCSLNNPFGIGYDTSVCENSKNFGVCGAPKDIYKYRDDIRKVQNDYLNSRIETVLFFGVDKEGHVLVKNEREGQWTRYDISEWKKIIDESNKKNEELIKNQDKLSNKLNQELGIAPKDTVERVAGIISYGNDIPVTEGNDLSVVYKTQGPLVSTRTKVGDIIRDNGLIQQAFISNYVDTGGDLISSHEVYVVVKEAEWVVGEKTPKNSNVEELPTPISTELLKKQSLTNKYQENVVEKYNINDTEGVVEAIVNNPEDNIQEDKNNLDIINTFIKEK